VKKKGNSRALCLDIGIPRVCDRRDIGAAAEGGSRR
jgi:hypothetical protein